MNTRRIVDVVIPTFRPDKRLAKILEILSRQTVPIRCIRMVNTGREGFEAFLEQTGLTEQQLREKCRSVSEGLQIVHILPEEFDHGATRSQGFSLCEGADYVLTMTQDALPENETLVEELLRPLEENEEAAVSYARQLPNEGASAEERISRAFNYPDIPAVKGWDDREQLGIKTFFCSNVCAMYRLKIWKELGGFTARTIFNEDMIYACHAQRAGYKVVYAAKARVFHSHSYNVRQQFQRNFDLGVSQAQNPDVFEGLSSEGEGMRYVLSVAGQLRKEKRIGQIPGFFVRCAARLAGYRMGKSYQRLPKGTVIRCSSNKNYWR